MFEKLCLCLGILVITIAIALELFKPMANLLGFTASSVTPADLVIVGFLICILGLMSRVFEDTGSADFFID